MIEINLARQLQTAPTVKMESYRSYGWMCAVLFLGICAASWWWTQIKHQEWEFLLQEKNVQTQSLEKIQTTLNRLEKLQKEKQFLSVSYEEMYAQELGKKQPMVLLEGVSRSVEGIDIWLDHIQMVGRIVELRGQSFALHEIGKYIDTLENHQLITSLPVVEILDQEDKDGGKVFSFFIRFVLGRQVTA
jgi:type IV pilus assembly PilN-like protein